MHRILDLSYEDLRRLVSSWDEPPYRADQILGWVYARRAASFEEMTDLPQRLRDRLQATSLLVTLEPVHEKVSADGHTRKVLFRLEDGKTIESSAMSYSGGRASRERRTVCVSTQVGCPIGCPFCATGQQGFERNLSPGEIVEQVLFFARRPAASRATSGAAESLRPAVTNVVLMGMGEPLANYGTVVRAIDALTSPRGLNLGARHLTVSTAGLVPQIRRLAGERAHVELAVSLHASSDGLRNELVPINRRFPLSELIPACAEYLERTGRRPTFEYALFKGINDSPRHARDLGALLRGLNCHVNLIAGNPTADRGFTPAPQRRCRVFHGVLHECGIPATIRLPRGTDIEAGCGQLRSRSPRA